MNTLLKNESIEEFFRQQLETAVNALLQYELSAFLGYEKYNSDGWGSGNSRNGVYNRSFDTQYGTLNLIIPRDRNGEFQQQTIPKHGRKDDALETTVIQLYRKGITTREIADLIEKMYGHHYSAQTISNITQSVTEQVEAFHSRTVEDKYAIIYCDATYLNLRRDSVAKEALHVILGITPDGCKEVLDYALYPSESAANYEEMLINLKTRGLDQVLLFVSDGLAGICQAVLRQFPKAKHQSCWVHLSRTICRLSRNKDRKNILNDLKNVYKQDTAEKADIELDLFVAKYKGKYKKVESVFSNRESLYSFYDFPPSIRCSIYTSNLIENNNKGLKHKAKLKEQFPNEDALERFVCSYYSEYNRKHSTRIHRGFKQSEAELLDMFEEKRNDTSKNH
jgi:transposase-like protein